MERAFLRFWVLCRLAQPEYVFPQATLVGVRKPDANFACGWNVVLKLCCGRKTYCGCSRLRREQSCRWSLGSRMQVGNRDRVGQEEALMEIKSISVLLKRKWEFSSCFCQIQRIFCLLKYFSKLCICRSLIGIDAGS